MAWRLPTDFFHTPRFIKRQQDYPPLVSDEELRYLRERAQRALISPLDVNLEVHHRLLGEKLSPFVKSGFEFAEIRAYQPGDNVRFINWRRFANTGQLYINRFHEERRPQCWIVMDRSSSMRFGTRIRLKVTQAAFLACFYFYKAQYQQMAVGGVIMESHNHWYEAKSSQPGLEPLLRHIVAPSPPVTETGTYAQLENILRSLQVRCPPGCLIFLLSDFRALQNTASTTLAALCAKHTVSALHIVDAVEQTLPSQGVFQLTDGSYEQALRVDCHSTRARQEMNTSLGNALQDTERLLKQNKLHYRRVRADQDLLSDERKTD